MSKHTPGPWALNPFAAQVDAFDQKGVGPVCELLWPTEVRSEAETSANGHLIAAAPEMYQALRSCFCPRPFNSRPDEFEAGDCFDADECGCLIGAALAKAGGQP